MERNYVKLKSSKRNSIKLKEQKLFTEISLSPESLRKEKETDKLSKKKLL